MSVAKYSKHQKSRMKKSVATYPNGHQIQADSRQELAKKMEVYEIEQSTANLGSVPDESEDSK